MKSLASKLISPARTWLLAAAGCVEAVDKAVSMPPGVRWMTVGFTLSVVAYTIWHGVRGWQYYSTLLAIRSIYGGKPIPVANGRYQVRYPTTFDQLYEALDRDSETYPEDQTWSLDRWREFHDRNKRVAYMLLDTENSDECLGGISIFPLKPDFAAKLSNGSRKETELRPDDLHEESEMDRCDHWHIGGIVLFEGHRTRRACELISGALHLWLNGLRDPFPINVTAFASTTMGGQLLRKLGFQRVPEHPEGDELGLYRLRVVDATALGAILSKIPRADS